MDVRDAPGTKCPGGGHDEAPIRRPSAHAARCSASGSAVAARGCARSAVGRGANRALMPFVLPVALIEIGRLAERDLPPGAAVAHQQFGIGSLVTVLL